MRSVLLVAAIAASLSGCVGLKSLEGDADGVVYHLPKTLLEITVRQYATLTPDGKVKRTWYALGGPNDNSKGVDADKSAEHAPFSQIKSHTVPDPEQRYVINYRPSPFSDDRLCLSRTNEGLLHDVQFAADDRTPEVIFNIARFLGGFLGSPPKPAQVSYGEKQDTTTKLLRRSYTNKIDPFNRDDVHAFNNALQRIFGERVKFDFSRMRTLLAEAMGISEDACDSTGCPPADWAKRCDPKSICYRTKISLPVHLKLNGHRIDVRHADVINAWDIGSISVTRAFLVQKITKLRFEQGALTAAIIRKPSEIEELSLIPVNVMTAILTVPTGLVQAAFSDYTVKAQVKQRLATAQTDMTSFAQDYKSNYNKLLLEGEPAIGLNDPANSATVREKYELNCSAGARSGFINLLNPNGGGDEK